MKFHASTELFLKTLSIAARACGSGDSMPILGCVHISASAATHRVEITANNLNLTIRTSFLAKVEKAGTVCIQGPRFRSIVAAVQGVDCSVEVNRNDRLIFKCGCSCFQIMGMAGDEFPALPSLPENSPILKFKQSVLRAVITSVCDAPSDDESRYILNGIAIQRGSNGLHFVATDGRRMHINNQPFDNTQAETTILPSTNIAPIMSMLGDDGDVVVHTAKTIARFVISRPEGEIEVTSKVVEGSYPQWQGVVPKYFFDGIRISRTDLLGAFTRVRLALDEKHTAVKVTLGETSLVLAGSTADIGEGREVVDYASPSKLTGEFSANVNLLIEALRAVSDEIVVLKVDQKSPSTSPVMLTTPEATLIIMPVRLS